MELRHMRYFAVLAEELHFSKAAERLRIAQPPLSQQIKQLEKELGVQLFYRTKRKVEMTEAGVVFLNEVRPILEQIEQAVDTIQRLSRGEVGRLTVGFVNSAMYNFLHSALHVFHNRYPDIALTLREQTSAQQVQSLLKGRIHIGFLRPPIKEDCQILLETVVKECLVVALPEGHYLACYSQIALADLKNCPFILFPRSQGAGFYHQILALCAQAGFEPDVVQEAVEMQTIVSLVAAGMGISLVPESLRNLHRSGVIYRDIVERTSMISLAMAWRRNESNLSVPVFLETVRQYIAATRPEVSQAR